MKTRRATFMIAMLVAISLAGATQAQNKTNVNGTWKMNRAKSTFAEGGGPDAITIKFEQQDQTLREALTVGGSNGERTLNLTYTMDGKPGTVQVDGREVTTIATWEGASLVLVLKPGDQGSFTRKFTMSADGKAMTVAVRQSGPQGDKDDTVFLEKQ